MGTSGGAPGRGRVASVTLPAPLQEMDPTELAQLLSRAEIALGVALLTPFVPSRLAGAARTTFGGGLLSLYMRTPGMRQEGSIRPTQAGTALAKDVWLVGAGLTLLLD